MCIEYLFCTHEQADIHSPRTEWTGFKIVGDDIDKNTRPANQRIDRRTKSFHYFHSYAMLDRINWTDVSISQPVVEDLDPRSFLLTLSEVERLKEDFHIVMSRYRSSKCRERSQGKACCARVLVMRMKNEFSHESGNVQCIFQVVISNTCQPSPIW